MKVIKTKFEDLYIIKQKRNVDRRGNLRETYRKNVIKRIWFKFKQKN